MGFRRNRNKDDHDDDSSSSGESGIEPSNVDTSTNIDSTKGGTGTGATEKSATSESSTLAKAETLAVNRTKLCMLAVLTVAAIGVGVATYFFTHATEVQEFESKFHDSAKEMEELVHDEARNVFLTIGNFATTVTSLALATRAVWPFVTVPHFEVRGTELNVLAGSLMVGFSPVVKEADREQWEMYTQYEQGWIHEGVEYSKDLHAEFQFEAEHLQPIYPAIYRTTLNDTHAISDHFHVDNHSVADGNSIRTPDKGRGPYLPIWQQVPAPHDTYSINYNLFRHPVFNRIIHGMNETLRPVLSEATDLEFFYGGSIRDALHHPHSFLLQPVFQDFNESHRDHTHIVGVAIAILPWDQYFEGILPPEAHGMIVVMEDTCGDQFSYHVDGADAEFLGFGDFHNSKYDHLEVKSLFAPFDKQNYSGTHEHCEYDIHIYPSQELEDDFLTNKPFLYAALVMGVFAITAAVFVVYDVLVQRRQDKVSLAAKKSNAVVKSLFPKNVRDRIMADVEAQLAENDGKISKSTKLRLGSMPKSELKNFLDDGINQADCVPFDTKPIADLFLSTTVMFGDIAGFTAWSSVREPTQVFTLLETLYHGFDEIAKRRRVFKVETIGDCYVAVTGLPEPRKDHACVMARFSRDCIGAMNDLTKRLEVTLGPDTGDLSLRVGLHSGPVTAGVLRGEKSRFQLFGDTVNTAARMESNGVRNRIHVSKECADLLKMAGKGHWITPRNDMIEAKGKGKMQTYFLDIKKQSSGSQRSANSSEGEVITTDMSHLDSLSSKAGTVSGDGHNISADLKRKIEWNADILLRLLQQIIARRDSEEKYGMEASWKSLPDEGSKKLDIQGRDDDQNGRHSTVLDEVKETIVLPEFNATVVKHEEDPKDIVLPPAVVNQVKEFVTVIASLYHAENPFHNFLHASHVTMSVMKLLSRIVAPEDVLKDQDEELADSALHEHTFGITSDPMTQFACAFSAMIHDCDHPGVPNAQLIKEHQSIAELYRNQSIAEQNSVDLAWGLLMEDNFKDFRDVIYKTADEQRHFRALVVNVVLATDICDKELKKLRNDRWTRAFHGEAPKTEEEITEAINRKATIVLEHLIQASDVAHTMQHWYIYRKWNENFFHENMKAFKDGRAEKDPTAFWYEGEIGFFDFYIIPLAKKLKECGIFGVSSDEYLNYALSNRQEWVLQGKQVVAEMSAKYLPPLTEGEEAEEELEDEECSSDEREGASSSHGSTVPISVSSEVSSDHLKMEEFKDEVDV